MHKDIKKRRPLIKLVLKRFQTFAENYFIKSIFPKIGTFYVFRRSKHNFP